MLSTLPETMRKHAEKCKIGYDRYASGVLGTEIKELKEEDDKGYLYVCSDDQTITRKELDYYFDALKVLQVSYKTRIDEIRKDSVNDFRRLKHNIAEYNANNKDEIEAFLSLGQAQDTLRKNVEEVENVVRNHSRKAAFTLLRTYTNTTLIKSELIVHELVKATNPQLEIYPHPIHKVAKLSYQPYFIEFIERRIRLNWSDCYDKVAIDYPSISVVLGHIWSNAIKYAQEDSEITVDFLTDEHSVETRVGMKSLYIEKDERERLTEEGYSGKWAKKLGKSGKGIGMSYIKKLTEMNGGTFSVECGDEKSYEGEIPYAWNTFILKLNKAT